MGKQRPWLADAMAVVGALALYFGHVRPWMYTWGADDDEIAAVLPGDELVSSTALRTTRAVTIDAPRHAVWPWLAQLGEHRGGFYSYSWLERGVGTAIHNANTVHPEWQNLGVGDTVWLAKRFGARQVVAAVEPKSHLVLMSPSDFARVQRGQQARGAWAFYLRRKGGQTRLIVRGSGGAVGHAGFDIPHFVMEQKMMRGIRKRAQQMRRSELGASALQKLSVALA